jgi:hypothetical protein
VIAKSKIEQEKMIAYKRMLAVMYEAACNDTSASDVVRVMSGQLAQDRC